MTDGFLHPAIARWTAIVAILLAGMLMPQSAQAAPSAYCPTLNASVSNGGSVAIDVSSCDGPFDGGMSGPIAPYAQHGVVTIGTNSGGSQFVVYAHIGDAGTSDQFYLEDNDLGVVTVNITISPPASPIAVAPDNLPALTAGTPFSQVLTSTGGTAPYTYNLQSGALPVGLSLTSNGLISGTPTQRGGYAFVVRSTDNIGQFVDKGYTGTVQNPVLSISPTSATVIQGIAFSQTLSASGGVPPYSYQVESGLLPPGISLSSSGLISGTTTAAPGSYPLMLRVTDSSTGPGAYFELENFTLHVAASPSVSISLSPASVAEDGAATMIYTLTRSAALSSSTLVNMTHAGTATSGTDYTGVTSTVTIPSGVREAIVVIDPVADADIEGDETVVLTIAPGSGYTIATPSSATGTILDDDRPTVSISVSPAQVTEDGVANLVYTATLDEPALTALAINYLVGGTATDSDDYYATITSPIIIPAGSTSATVVVDPIPDVMTEADETVVLTLAAGSGYDVGTPDSATGTILNDDLPTLKINNVTSQEGDSGTQSMQFSISLSSPAGPGGVTFDIATADGTATAGSDYVAKDLIVETIPAGSSTYNFSVDVNGDFLNEANETFFANVTNVSNAILADGQGVGTIVDDDALPSLSIDDVSVVEGNSGTRSMVFEVTLTGASGQTVTVNYATGDDTATQPGDYSGLSGGLRFDPGETTQTITIPVIGDAVPEADETFLVGLSGAVNANVTDGQGVGSIVNDDVPVTLSPASLPGGAVAASYSQTVAASGGTAPYNYSVTAGALPADLTLSAGGVLSGTPSSGGTFNFTITASDSSPAPGPFSDSLAYSLTIAPATLTLSSSTLAQGQVGVAYSDAIEPATGGTAPYSYAVTAGALPAGITLSAGGALSGTPSADGTFTFSITATDSSAGTGPYSATQSYTLTVGEAASLAGDVTATVDYGSSDNAIALDLSGGTATGVALVTAPAHGTATVSGTSISYTPDTGFAGTDSFTYTASNAGGTSAPATASITVSAPVIDIAATGPLTATVGTAYNQSFTFSGGTQPFSAYQVTGLPTGLSITGTTVNSITIAGTPVQSGSFALDVSASDSSTGDGPFPASRSFTLSVNAPTLAMIPASGTLNAAYAAPFSQTFTASGGAGPYDYSITGTLPAGLTFNAATATLDGTPGDAGDFSFSVVATDTGSSGPGSPYTVQGDYTLRIAAPTISIAPATLPEATAHSDYSAMLAATGAVAPYSFSITDGALPAGLSLGSDGQISGVPAAAGEFTIEVTATDSNAQTGVAELTLSVGNAPLEVTPDTLPDGLQGVAYRQQLTTSGGFAPYSYAIVDGELPDGLALDAGSGLISGIPVGSGPANVTIRVSDSTASTPSTREVVYGFTIVARPNPADDPEVRGLVQAQVNTARRLVESQVGNFSRRLEGMHRGGSGGGFQNGLRLRSADLCRDTLTAWTNSACANYAPNGWNNRPGAPRSPDFGNEPAQMLTSARVGGAAIGGGDQQANAKGSNGSANGGDVPWTIWGAGTIRYGDLDEMTGRPSQRFESEGISFGADYRFTPSFAAGIGVGLGRDTATVGRNGSLSEGEAKTLAIYGSHLFGSGVYFDWLAGYQRLDFDLRRYVTSTGDIVNSSRSGRQWFASMSAGADIDTGAWRLTPYGRVDALRGRLDGYSETSGSIFDLTFLDQHLAFMTLAAGAKIDHRITVENGYFVPRLRIEYQRDIERDSEALVAYFDQASGLFSSIPIIGYSRSRLLVATGVEMMIGETTAVDVEYSNRRNSGAGSDQGVLINVKQAF